MPTKPWSAAIPKLSKKDKIVLAIQSVAGIFLFNLLLFYGIRHTSGIEAGLILSLSPVFVAALSFLFLKETITYWKSIGIILAIIGIIVINLTGLSSFSLNPKSLGIIGNLMIVGVALCEAIFTVSGKYNTNKLSPYQISFIITLLSFVLFLPMLIYDSLKINYALIDTTVMLQMLYFIIFIGMVPYVLVYTAMKHITATAAGVLSTLIPISGILLSIIFLGESISAKFIFGALISLTGMFITAIFD